MLFNSTESIVYLNVICKGRTSGLCADCGNHVLVSWHCQRSKVTVGCIDVAELRDRGLCLEEEDKKCYFLIPIENQAGF